MSESGWRWTTLAISVLALGASTGSWIVASQVKHAQFDESLVMEIDSYTGQDLDSEVLCSGDPYVSKPYRVSIINKGHVPLTVVSVDVDIDRPLGSTRSTHIEMKQLHEKRGEFVPLPLKLDVGEAHSFITYMPYGIAPSVVTLLCNPLNPPMSRSQMARVLASAKIDLLGNPIHPAVLTSSEPAYLVARDLSNLPALRVTVGTANGLRHTDVFHDKAGL